MDFESSSTIIVCRHASAEEWAQLSSSERHPDEVAAAIAGS